MNSRRRWALCISIAAMAAASFSADQTAAGRTVRIGVYQNEPKIFMDSAGRASGIYIDLLNEMAGAEGWTLAYVPCQWADCLAALEAGQIELMPDVAYSAERAQKYDFHKTPVLESWSQIYANSGMKVNGYEDLAGKRVAVLKGSIQLSTFEQNMSGSGFAVTLIPTNSLEEAFDLASKGSADAAIANNFFGDYFYKEYGLVKTPIVFQPAALFYATAKGRNTDLLEAIDRHLNAWLQEPNSPYYTTLSRWTKIKQTPVYRVPQYVNWVVGIIAGLFILSVALVFLLRGQVRARTKHLEKANEALRESEERYRLLFSTSNDAILLTAPDGSIFSANPAACRIFGRTEEEIRLVGRDGVADPSDPGLAPALEERARKGSFHGELALLRKDGAKFYGEVSTALFESEKGEPRSSMIIRDITERKESEARLAESERRYRELVENANSIILRWTHDGRITFLNEFGQRFFGYSAEEILGRPVLGTIVPAIESDGRDLGRLMDQILSDPAAFEQNVNENMRRNGERVWISWTNRIVRDGQGRAIEIQSIGTDVSERKNAEEALRDRENQLSLILNNVSDVVFAIAVEPNDVFRFVSVNHRFLEITGLRENQIVGALARDVIPEPSHPLVFGKYREAIQSGQPVHWEEVSEYPTGRKIGVVTIVPVLDPRGICTQLVGMVHDITESKQAEEAIRELNVTLERRVVERTAELAVARDRAEAADRLKSAFLATMSHELRTPLNSIIGFTGIILQGLAGPLTAEQRKQLDMVRDSSRHLLALINDVLDISKIEAGQLEIHNESFDPRASIEKVIGIVKPLAEKKGLSLNVTVAPEIGALVSDPRRVEQILINLLNNAIKFTGQGGVTVTAITAPYPYHAPQSALRISIADTGIGIKPEDFSQLFLPFRQIDSGLTRQHEGTGLGLAICRRLTELLGGEISAESTWGQGSVFLLTLPVAGTEKNENDDSAH
jgi:PAS domain S-box-containing protein